MNELGNVDIQYDDVFNNKHMTFEDIEKLNYNQILQNASPGEEHFKPSDILDIDEGDGANDSDDEILKKFRSGPPATQNPYARLPAARSSNITRIN